MRKILSVDPGSKKMGYALFCKESSSTLARPVLYGQFTAAAKDFMSRLKDMRRQFEDLLNRETPHEVAIEEIFVGKNVNSAFKLGLVRGVIIGECLKREMSIFEYTPRQVKSIVVGHGRASKEDVLYTIKQRCQLDLPVNHYDISDAIAIGFAHFHLQYSQSAGGL